MEDYKVAVLSASFEKSSNITKAEYDPFMRVLSLTFKNGGIYDYVDVDEKLFHEMSLAESAGRFFHSKIRGHYDFLKKPTAKKKVSDASEDSPKKEKGKRK